MSNRQIRLLLNTLTAVSLIAAGGVLWWTWRMPGSAESVKWQPPQPPNNLVLAPQSGEIKPEDFVDFWQRPWRQPLYDPPAQPEVVETPTPTPEVKPKPIPRPAPPPQLPIRLVGTVIEAGRSMAIVTDASGRIDLKQVGETLDLEPAGVRIDEIDAEMVTVSYQGRQSRLSLSDANLGRSLRRDIR